MAAAGTLSCQQSTENAAQGIWALAVAAFKRIAATWFRVLGLPTLSSLGRAAHKLACNVLHHRLAVCCITPAALLNPQFACLSAGGPPAAPPPLPPSMVSLQQVTDARLAALQQQLAARAEQVGLLANRDGLGALRGHVSGFLAVAGGDGDGAAADVSN